MTVAAARPALFEPPRHEALTTAAWTDDAARDCIQQIVQRAAQSFTPQGLWPPHPLDDMPPGQTLSTNLYDGAAGTIWACRHLAAAGALRDPGVLPDFNDTVRALTTWPAQGVQLDAQQRASFFIGDTGTLLLQWQQDRDPAVAAQILALVQGNFDNPTREALWGNPGSVLAAVHLAEATSGALGADLVEPALQRLLHSLQADPDTGTPIWTQDLYGRKVRYLGAGHGLVGNVYAALRGAAWAQPATVQALCDAGLATLQATALRGDGDGSVDGDGLLINWHPISDATRVRGRMPLVQDCHGAPGVINRLAGVAQGDSWDALLLGAGAMTWHAGPLRKGPGLCHGTAGNAHALLKLARRTGQALWLDRARAMAWHAALQVQAQWAEHGRARPSLWVGDLGVACALWACLSGDDRLPTLDVF